METNGFSIRRRAFPGRVAKVAILNFDNLEPDSHFPRFFVLLKIYLMSSGRAQSSGLFISPTSAIPNSLRSDNIFICLVEHVHQNFGGVHSDLSRDSFSAKLQPVVEEKQ